MKLKALSALAILFAFAAGLHAQGIPDCQFSSTFSAQAPGNAQANKSTPCLAWRMTYYTSAATGVSVRLEGTDDIAGSPNPAGWTALTAVSGTTSPAIGTANGEVNACCDYYPWIRVNPTTLTGGAGFTLTARTYGYKGTSAAAVPPGTVTNPMTATGDMIVGAAAGFPARLPGNITTEPLCLVQTGTGAISAAPSWVTCPTTGRTATKVIAAANSTAREKAQADYVCTGTNDQTTINAALAAAPGGSVYLSPGNYFASAVTGQTYAILIDSDGAYLYGPTNAVVKLTDGQNADVVLVNTNRSHTRVSGFTIDGNRSQNTDDGTHHVNCVHISADTTGTGIANKVDNMIFLRCVTTSVLADAEKSTMENSWSEDAEGAGFESRKDWYKIVNNWVTCTTDGVTCEHAIESNGGDYGLILGNHAWNSASTYTAGLKDGILLWTSPYYTTVADNIVEFVSRYALTATDAAGAKITGNTFGGKVDSPVDGTDLNIHGNEWFYHGAVISATSTGQFSKLDNQFTSGAALTDNSTAQVSKATVPIISGVIATPPASPATGQLVMFIDALTVADCTVGTGTAKSLCIYNGSAWQKP